MKQKVTVTIVGPEPSCARCRASLEAAEQFVKANQEKYDVEIKKIDMNAATTIENYGVLRGPAIIVNDMVISQGEVPKSKTIEAGVAQVLKMQSK